MKNIVKKIIFLLKRIILLCLIVIGYILFVSNANVRINIKNNTSNILHDIKIFTNSAIQERNIFNPFNEYNIVYKNKKEVNNKSPIVIKFELDSKTYEKKIYSYIEINDAYILFIQINKNGKVTYKGKKLLFSINISETFKNYWYSNFSD